MGVGMGLVLGAALAGCVATPRGVASAGDGREQVATGERGADAESASPGARGAAPTATDEPAGAVLINEVPYQSWAPLPGKVVGLLVSATSPWGAQIDWTRNLSTVGGSATADGRVYWFLADRRSPQVLYFESKGEGRNFLEQWSVPLADGGAATYDAAMFGPSTPNRFGLFGDVHLVEVEVNGGRGAAAGLHFVATDVRVLDGASAGGLVPAQALTLARQRFEQLVVDRRADVEARLDEAKRAARPAVGAETTVVNEGMFPTWDHEDQTLEVLFLRQVRRQSQRTEMRQRAYRCKKYRAPPPPPGGPNAPNQLPGGALRPCPAPRSVAVTVTVSYGVEIAEATVFDRSGRLIAVTTYAPGALPVQELRPVDADIDF
jgi:hypothetical protein